MKPDEFVSFLIDAGQAALDPKLSVVLPDSFFDVAAKIAMLIFIWLTPFFIVILLADKDAPPEALKIGFWVGVASAVFYTGLLANESRSFIVLWAPLMGVNAGLRFLGTFAAVRSFFAAHPLVRILILASVVAATAFGFAIHDPAFWVLNLLLTVISAILTITFTMRLTPDKPGLAFLFGLLAVIAGLMRPDVVIEPQAFEFMHTPNSASMVPAFVERINQGFLPALALTSFAAFKMAFITGICFGCASRIIESPGDADDEKETLERWGVIAGSVLFVGLLVMVAYKAIHGGPQGLAEPEATHNTLPADTPAAAVTQRSDSILLPSPSTVNEVAGPDSTKTASVPSEPGPEPSNPESEVPSAIVVPNLVPEVPLAITASELVRLYREDRRAADEQYRGHPVRVTGVVEKVGRDYVSLKDSSEANRSVRCKCADNSCRWLAEIQTGSTVAVSGIVKGKRFTGRVEVERCELAR